MSIKCVLSFAIVVSMALLTSCAVDLKPTGHLITHTLVHEPGAKTDGQWRTSKTGMYKNLKKGALYFSPLDTSLIDKEYPEEAVQLRHQMHGHIVKYIGQAITDTNRELNLQWRLTDSPADATIRIDMQIVKLKPTKTAANILSFIGSLISPIPGTSTVISSFTKGSIGIEGCIADGKTGEHLYEFKDTNRDRTFLFSFNDYKRFGHSEKYMENWAKHMAESLCKNVRKQRK